MPGGLGREHHRSVRLARQRGAGLLSLMLACCAAGSAHAEQRFFVRSAKLQAGGKEVGTIGDAAVLAQFDENDAVQIAHDDRSLSYRGTIALRTAALIVSPKTRQHVMQPSPFAISLEADSWAPVTGVVDRGITIRLPPHFPARSAVLALERQKAPAETMAAAPKIWTFADSARPAGPDCTEQRLYARVDSRSAVWKFSGWAWVRVTEKVQRGFVRVEVGGLALSPKVTCTFPLPAQMAWSIWAKASAGAVRTDSFRAIRLHLPKAQSCTRTRTRLKPLRQLTDLSMRSPRHPRCCARRRRGARSVRSRRWQLCATCRLG